MIPRGRPPGVEARTNEPDWLVSSILETGVIVLPHGSLAQVIEVEPMHLPLHHTETVTAVLDQWLRLVRDFPHPIDIRVSQRPQDASVYLATLAQQQAQREQQAASEQDLASAAILATFGEWIAGTLVPASRQRVAYWWPSVNPVADVVWGQLRPREADVAAEAAQRLLPGLRALKEHVERACIVLDELGLTYTVYTTRARVRDFLYRELHPFTAFTTAPTSVRDLADACATPSR